jgi:hypothetical protein
MREQGVPRQARTLSRCRITLKQDVPVELDWQMPNYFSALATFYAGSSLVGTECLRLRVPNQEGDRGSRPG